MKEQGDADFDYPDTVSVKRAEDGGALVTAKIGTNLVFQRCFGTYEEAREFAPSLFDRTFEVPDDHEEFPF